MWAARPSTAHKYIFWAKNLDASQCSLDIPLNDFYTWKTVILWFNRLRKWLFVQNWDNGIYTRWCGYLSASTTFKRIGRSDSPMNMLPEISFAQKFLASPRNKHCLFGVRNNICDIFPFSKLAIPDIFAQILAIHLLMSYRPKIKLSQELAFGPLNWWGDKSRLQLKSCAYFRAGLWKK